jgi:hypothetical protein
LAIAISVPVFYFSGAFSKNESKATFDAANRSEYEDLRKNAEKELAELNMRIAEREKALQQPAATPVPTAQPTPFPVKSLDVPWVCSKLTRFEVELIHPSNFKRLKGGWEDPNFQGSLAALNTDTISDGVMSVRVEYEADDFENSWERELKKDGSGITYKTKKSDWYVVSGVRADGIEFYRKVWLIDSWCFSFDAQYPHKLNSKYDLVLERMLKGFKPKITQW